MKNILFAMQRRDRNSGQRRGFTLTEIGLVLGVIGALVAAIWSAAGDTNESRKESEAVQQAQTISRGVLNFMQGRSFLMPNGTNITAAMANAQAIPPSYINPTTGSIDNPWNVGAPDTMALVGGVWVDVAHSNKGIEMYSMTPTLFRLSFYNVSRAGCAALLSQLTACDSIQSGCPLFAYTAQSAQTCQPGQTNCPTTTTAAATFAPSMVDWQSMSASSIATMCNKNSYTGGVNSVEFDYSL